MERNFVFFASEEVLNWKKRARQGHGELFSGVDGNLLTTLVPNESGLHFQLNLDSTPTFIAELLSNHVFGSSSNLTDPRMVSTIYQVVESTKQSASFTARTEEDLFGAFKR